MTTEIYNPDLHKRSVQSITARRNRLYKKTLMTAGREYAERQRQVETAEYIMFILNDYERIKNQLRDYQEINQRRRDAIGG